MSAKCFTASEQVVDLCHLEASQVKIVDFAMPMSRIPRFQGHTPPVWSVLSHTGLVYRLALQREAKLSDTQRLSLLLHDAPEGYIGDMPGPLKAMPEFETFRKIEEEILHSIWKRFGLSWSQYDAEIVDLYDHQAAYVEMETFFPRISRDEPDLYRVEPRYILSPLPILAVGKVVNYGHELHRLAEIIGTASLEALFAIPVHVQKFMEPLEEDRVDVSRELNRDVENMRV